MGFLNDWFNPANLPGGDANPISQADWDRVNPLGTNVRDLNEAWLSQSMGTKDFESGKVNLGFDVSKSQNADDYMQSQYIRGLEQNSEQSRIIAAMYFAGQMFGAGGGAAAGTGEAGGMTAAEADAALAAFDASQAGSGQIGMSEAAKETVKQGLIAGETADTMAANYTAEANAGMGQAGTTGTTATSAADVVEANGLTAGQNAAAIAASENAGAGTVAFDAASAAGAGSAGGMMGTGVASSGTTAGAGGGWGQAVSTGANLLGGYMQGEAAKDAAETQANANIQAAQIAAEAARFKPIGVTTNFGKSKFEYDPSGNLKSAGYSLSPQLQAQQNQIMGATDGLLNQFTGAQAATAPMGDAAGRMMTLGNQYLAKSPQEQAQMYLGQQQGLLAPQRATDIAQLQAQMQAQGRGGFAMGGGVNGQGAANPQLQALYNARMQQDAQLAANATQGGMDYAKFGSGMVGSGGDMLKGMFGTQNAAYGPYSTALGGAQTLEGLGQQPFDLSINLGAKGQAAGATQGQMLQSGMNLAASSQAKADAYSPWAGLLSGGAEKYDTWQKSQQPTQIQPMQYQYDPNAAYNNPGYFDANRGVNY